MLKFRTSDGERSLDSATGYPVNVLNAITSIVRVSGILGEKDRFAEGQMRFFVKPMPLTRP